MTVQLKISDREDLGDAKLLIAICDGNVKAALIGGEVEDALRNAERQAEQVLSILRRVRERVLGS